MVLDGHRHRNIVVIVILMPNGVNTYNMGGYGSSSKKYHCLMSKSLPRCIAYRSPWYTGLSLASTTTHLLCTWSPRRQEACSPSARMKQCCRTSSCSALAAPLRRPARGVDLRQSACTKCTSGQSSLTDTKATSTRTHALPRWTSTSCMRMRRGASWCWSGTTAPSSIPRRAPGAQGQEGRACLHAGLDDHSSVESLKQWHIGTEEGDRRRNQRPFRENVMREGHWRNPNQYPNKKWTCQFCTFQTQTYFCITWLFTK